jgi:ZIP family zinc transporter
MIVFLLSIATFVSTLCGGLFALRHQDKLHRILGFTAGIIMGVVAFDLLPEIFNIVHQQNLNSSAPMVALIVGFLAFHIAEKSIIMHHAHEEEYGKHHHPQVGVLSALALAGHSLLDGIAIGLGFQAGNAIGTAIALAVIAHDFADGINTVGLLLAHKNKRERVIKFLVLDALAPVIGVLLGTSMHISDKSLVLYLGFFTGFLLYIGAADILPEAHSKHSTRATIALTVLGATCMFVISRVLG